MKTRAGSGDTLFILSIDVGKWLAPCDGLFLFPPRYAHFGNGSSFSTKEVSALLCRPVCCTTDSAWAHTSCRWVQFTLKFVHPLARHIHSRYAEVFCQCRTKFKSHSKLCYNRRSIDQSILVSHPNWGPTPEFCYCCRFFIRGILFDKEDGTIANIVAGPIQRTHP
jgi:hypothetical protein